MIELKSPTEIHRMQLTGNFVAQVLTELSELADVGVNLLELEHHARSRIHQRGAQSCYWITPRPLATARSATSSACRSTTRSSTGSPMTTHWATETC